MLGRRKEESPTIERAVRSVPVRILTSAGWIVGKLHVSNGWQLIDFMNHAQDFFTLEDTVLEGRPKVLPLFTLRRSAIQFVVVETDEDMDEGAPARNKVEHPVACLLQSGTLHGRIQITRSVRLADYLSKNSGFLVMREAHYHLKNPWEDRAVEHREPAVLLNPKAVVGISDFSAEA
jgi:hypothetical protein